MMNNAIGDLYSVGELSVDLVNKAEESVADTDLDALGDAAGMVLVGDTYAVRVAHEALPYTEEPASDGSGDPELSMIDSLNPFIR